MSFFEGIKKELKKHNEYVDTYSDVKQWIDTGSYALNALLSGSIHGGIPNNKILVFAGESTTGKTYFTLGIVSQFLKDNPNGGVFYFETEHAITTEMLSERGISEKQLTTVPVTTIQEFRHQAIKILDHYKSLPEKERPPIMFCLDSLGMLSTTKEIADTAEGSETKDMTRAQIIKSAFRVLTLKLGQLNVPLIVTNHTYETMGMFSTKEMSGGSGLKYASDYVVFLSKKKEKDGDEVVGNIIHCLNKKSRLTIENKKIDVLLRYDTGLSRYHGMIDFAVEAEVFKKMSTKIELPDGTSTFAKTIMKNPEKYFTEDVLKQIDQYCKKEFTYGNVLEKEELEDEE
jgi:RecA/RadA recombinase